MSTRKTTPKKTPARTPAKRAPRKSPAAKAKVQTTSVEQPVYEVDEVRKTPKQDRTVATTLGVLAALAAVIFVIYCFFFNGLLLNIHNIGDIVGLALVVLGGVSALGLFSSRSYLGNDSKSTKNVVAGFFAIIIGVILVIVCG